MNHSYNDEQKQANPVSSMCWGFLWFPVQDISQVWMTYATTDFKSSDKKICISHRFVVVVVSAYETPNIFGQFYFNQARTQGKYQVNWDPGYKSFVNVFQLPYHFCSSRIFSASEKSFYFLQSKTGIKTMKIK